MRLPMSAPTPAPISAPATWPPAPPPHCAPSSVPVFSFGPVPVSGLPAQAASRPATPRTAKVFANDMSTPEMRTRTGTAGRRALKEAYRNVRNRAKVRRNPAHPMGCSEIRLRLRPRDDDGVDESRHAREEQKGPCVAERGQSRLVAERREKHERRAERHGIGDALDERRFEFCKIGGDDLPCPNDGHVSQRQNGHREIDAFFSGWKYAGE